MHESIVWPSYLKSRSSCGHLRCVYIIVLSATLLLVHAGTKSSGIGDGNGSGDGSGDGDGDAIDADGGADGADADDGFEDALGDG